MKKPTVHFVVIILSLACGGIYGISKVKPVNENTIFHYASKFNIPPSDSYRLDSTFSSYLFSLDSLKYKEEIKNHYQPLQALYYSKLGMLESFQVNCYAGGFPNLEWSRDEIMTTFPPKLQAPLDTILSREKLLSHLRAMSQTEKISPDSYDYLVFVFWNRFMGNLCK